jgi:hypothetical protein
LTLVLLMSHHHSRKPVLDLPQLRLNRHLGHEYK